MTTQVVHYTALPDRERRKVQAIPTLSGADRVELHVRRAGGAKTVTLPAAAAEAVEAVLRHLFLGERVAVLADEQELTPNEAARLLGISRPLVVHRMEVGDLPFRYVGKHRRARLKDVLALKAVLDARQAAVDALAADTEELIERHGL